MHPLVKQVINCLLCFFVICSIFKVIHALHEDQIGLHDWHLQFIGRPIEVLLSATQGPQRSLAYAYTEQNVLAAVDLKYGDIAWRQIFENNSNGTVLSMVLTDEEVCVLLNHGRIVRCFDHLSGAFKWERTLSSRDGNSGMCISVAENPSERNFNRVVCVCTDRITAFSSKDGRVIWDHTESKNEKRLAFQPQPNEIIIVGLGENSVSVKRLMPATGDVKEGGFQRSAVIDPVTVKCKLVQPASQVSPFVVCLDGSTKRIFVLPTDPDRVQQIFRLEDLGVSEFASSGATMKTYVVDGIFTSTSDGQTAIFQLHSDGKVTLIKKLLNGIVHSCSEKELAVMEIVDQTVTIRPAKVEISTLIYTGDESQSAPYQAAFGTLRNGVALSTKAGGCSKISILFWTDGDVFGYFTQGKLGWKREEGLASLNVTAVVDLPISDIEALVEEEFKEKGSFLVRFSKRLVSQGLQLKKLVEMAGKRIMTGLRTGKFFQKDQLQRDYFNTQKLLVGITDSGKIFGLDSRSGDIVYSILLKNFAKPKNRKIRFYLQRSGAHAPFPSQAVVIGADKETGNGLLYFFDCITGEQLQEPLLLPGPILQSGLIPVMTSNHLEAIFVLDSELNVSIYPPLGVPEVQEFVLKSLHIFDTDLQTGVFKGYRVKSVNKVLKAQEVWSVSLTAPAESIAAVTPKRPHDLVYSQGRVLADRRVLYKYINPNIVSVIVEGKDEAKKPYIKVIGFDGVTGRVVLSLIHRRARSPCHVVHSENWIMYTYWNEKVRSNELGVIEMYRGFDKPNKTYFSSLESHEKPELSAVAFKLPGFVSAISDTVTVESITHKNLIVALTSGSLMQIPKVLLDPRRPMFPTQAEREEGLIPYAPEIPLVTENVINYYKKAHRIRAIQCGVAGLESISLIFAHGLDLFFTRVNPSGLFDVLSDSFDYWILSVVMLVMTVASVIVRNLANAKALKHAWK